MLTLCVTVTNRLIPIGAASCYPASMVKNLVRWCQIFEVLQLLPQKRAKRSQSVGIVGISHVWARQCTSTPSLQNGCIFGLQDTWFHVPMLLSDDMINITSEPDWVHNRSWVATDSTSWDYQACTRDTLWRQHYVMTNKNYLINCHILLQYFK